MGRAGILLAALAAFLLPGLLAGAAAADEAASPDAVPLEVTVLSASDQPREEDPRCKRFDKILRGEIPYQSLAVLDTQRRRVGVNEIWEVELPTQRTLKVVPLEVSDQSTLLSLDIEESVQGDFRVQRGQPLVVGGPRYGDGRLVVVLDAH